jgi:hypothetical protein
LNNKYIILGGHMGAYDTDKFPYLNYEKKWLKKAIENKYTYIRNMPGSTADCRFYGWEELILANQIEFGFKNLEFLAMIVFMTVSKTQKFSLGIEIHLIYHLMLN